MMRYMRIKGIAHQHGFHPRGCSSRLIGVLKRAIAASLGSDLLFSFHYTGVSRKFAQ